ncbi:MAG: hypothetical protein JW736_08345 [Deltaproteobacteria bacterium]|nr:hypothetical protein [Deltaproteobacteria bacterium]MBN2688142.1 hypothetical protein [Deltaproteobacteria bacterium]
MHLSVVTPRKISPDVHADIRDYLIQQQFRKDGDCFVSTREGHCLEITIDMEPENDLCWTYPTSEVIWFIPMTEIIIESKGTAASHMAGYDIALHLAGIAQGIIYDHLVDVAYNREGKPFERYGLGENLAQYGTGMNRLTEDE